VQLKKYLTQCSMGFALVNITVDHDGDRGPKKRFGFYNTRDRTQADIVSIARKIEKSGGLDPTNPLYAIEVAIKESAIDPSCLRPANATEFENAVWMDGAKEMLMEVLNGLGRHKHMTNLWEEWQECKKKAQDCLTANSSDRPQEEVREKREFLKDIEVQMAKHSRWIIHFYSAGAFILLCPPFPGNSNMLPR
jgi:hypothetical protein